MGNYTVQQLITANGIIDLSARAATEVVTANNVLSLLKTTYGLLRSKN